MQTHFSFLEKDYNIVSISLPRFFYMKIVYNIVKEDQHLGELAAMRGREYTAREYA
jgi:hypothetical protein